MIVVDICRVVDFDAVKGVDGCLGDGDVSHVSDGKKAEQCSLCKVPRVLVVLPSQEDPEDDVEHQYG